MNPFSKRIQQIKNPNLDLPKETDGKKRVDGHNCEIGLEGWMVCADGKNENSVNEATKEEHANEPTIE